jgi:hypothetical protein
LSRNLLSELLLFLLYLAGRRPMRLVWNADGKQTDGSPATVLDHFDVLPRPPYRLVAGTPLAVTSKHERLLPEHFGSAAGEINIVGARGMAAPSPAMTARLGRLRRSRITSRTVRHCS